MDIQALEAFIAVAGCGSFSMAAEQLHVTQPAISKRVAGLESDLGCSLFDRLPREAVLTPSGQALLIKARHIVDEIHALRSNLSDLSGNLAGTLKLCTSHHIGLHKLPPLLRLYRQLYPQVKLELHFLGSEEAFTAVEQGKVDLAFATLPEENREKLNASPLWHDPLVFVCARDHQLAQRKKLQLQDLADVDAILPETDTVTYQVVANLFKDANLKLQVALPTNYLETIKMMLSVGLGWGVLPVSMLDNSLKTLPINSVPLSRELGLLTRKGKTLTMAAQRFIELTEQHN
ncbi:MAG: LysR family transcriptional regulator [Oceanospirillaceae bacterium]|nr:LysR family transcriptional regulator [Oceanospirillaceae bacterium]